MVKRPKFKVGDKVIGNKRASRYSYTKEGFIGTVVESGVIPGFIEVMPVSDSCFSNEKFLVLSRCFDLLDEFQRPANKELDDFMNEFDVL